MSDTIRGDFKNNSTHLNYFKATSGGADIQVVECGYERCDPLHYWGTEEKRFHVLHYVMSGTGTYTIDGKTYQIGPRQGFYIPDDTPVFYQADEEDPWEYRWVSFSGMLADSYMNDTAISVENPVFDCGVDPFLEEEFSQIYRYSLNAEVGEYLVIGQFHLFFAGFIKRYPNLEIETKDEAAYSTEYIDAIAEYVKNNFGDPDCTVAAAADHVNLSRAYVYKLFIRHVGISPSKYIEKVRMTAACNLFDEGETSVAIVTEKTGYSDQFYFSNVFKKVVGWTPTQYMNLMVAEEDA